MSSTYTEDHLVEQPAIELIQDVLKWDYEYCYDEWSSGSSSLGRETRREVVIVNRLRPALEKLNPELPAEALDAAIEELSRDRSALGLVEANRETYRLIKNGIKVKVENRQEGGQEVKSIRIIDWDNPTNNDFFLTSQLWVSGDLYTRRPDLVGFVNGLPLVLIEFKKPGVHVREGYDKNVTDYKTAIPQIFHFNALVIVSNGTQSKLGSVSAKWGHYCEWKKIEAEEEVAELDEDGERKVERLLGQRYHLITREDRLDTVARDIVHHFINRGHQGKAMVVSIDKATALKMYVKVEAEWIAEKSRLIEALKRLTPGSPAYEDAYTKFQILDETDRALIVSSGQNEFAEMQRHGLDIRPHRERMVQEDLETQFKTPETPLGLVFVCAMWLTGFDAPSCSTIYLDKPMRGHTLMQTIARANRVYGEKVSGLIVDYANVFLELEKALAIYAGGRGGELPVKDKKELVEALRIALSQIDHFCLGHEVSLSEVEADPVKHLRIAVDRLARQDTIKDDFLGQANDISSLYKAIMPDPIIPELAPRCQVIQEVAKALRALQEPVDVTAVLEQIEAKLDDSIVAEAGLEPGEAATTIDLSKVDFDALEKKFAKSKTKNSEAVKLRALIERKLKNLIRFNASRYDFLERFEKMVEEYNKGSVTIEEFFEHLVKFSSELNEEETRHMREQVSEEELAAFDILTRPGPDLTQQEIDEIKKVCRDLFAKLKTEKLVLNWRNKRTSRAGVRIEIEKMLDAGLPEVYTSDLFEQKCGALFQHVLEKYPEPHSNVYQGGVA
ncbi:MAG: type I restriction endonuclease [Opitutaceae bacterium]